MGGASLAIANPSPNGRAIRLTTKPEKTFFGSALRKIDMLFFLALIE
jgi:hypothetical protein